MSDKQEDSYGSILYSQDDEEREKKRMISEDIPEEISIEDFITFPKYKYPHDPLEDLSISYSQPFCPYCGGAINTGFKCMNCGKQYYPKSNSSVTGVK